MNDLEEMYSDCRIPVRDLPRDLRGLLPEDKSDFGSVDSLEAVDADSLTALLPFLLMWIQDMNWPISGPISDLLVKAGEAVIPEIRWVLSGFDGTWKSHCISNVLARLPRPCLASVVPDLERIANHPTEWERGEGNDTDARECLSYLHGEG